MANRKQKKCRYSGCGKLFTQYQTTQVVCGGSISCALGYAEEKKVNNFHAETRVMRREINLKDRRYQLTKAQESFNAFIRERDKGLPCISCGTTDQNLRYDAGHYRTTGAHPELRFNEDNCHRQCHYNCNIKRSGNIADYRINMVKRIGAKRVYQIEGIHKPNHYTIDEIIAIKKTYRIKLKQLQRGSE